MRLPVHSYQLRSAPASGSRLVNCFAEALPPGAKTPVALIRAPGIGEDTFIQATGTGPIRAMHYALGFLWIVSGGTLTGIAPGPQFSTFNTSIGSNSGPVDIDSNDTSVVVVNNGAAYYTTPPFSAVTQITDLDFPGATDVEFLDNFLLFVEPNSGRFFCADLGSASSFNALNFATAESAPDDLVGMKVDHRQILLFGEQTIEIWENIGSAGFPFARSINGVLEIGCLNGRTVAKQDNSVFWLANDNTVRRLDGNTPARVSQHGIEQKLSNDVTIAEGKAFAYSQEGHFFYVLTFPEATLVYDVTTREWHERQSYGYDYWLAGAHAQAFGLEFVGSSNSNRVGYLDPEKYSDAASWFGGSTTNQRMEWTYQPVYAEGRRAFHHSLEMILETGVGLTTGQGSDPEIMLDKSDDGGITWQSLPNKKIGKIGKYGTRVRWYGLGSAAQRVYRAAVSDPVKMVVTDTQLHITGGWV